ncbi:MAG: hypothetical protein EOO29_40925 [Comamonadaceae bacterium]|nr:MAG: hypothetical protein EOO29_40925 [Comamonadaceae bacterium]
MPASNSSSRLARWLRLGTGLTAVALLSACVVAPPAYEQSRYPYQPAPAVYPAQVAPYGSLRSTSIWATCPYSSEP